MRQILQNLKTGNTELADVPCPQVAPGHVLIQTRASVISAGTERMLVEFSQANLLDKARQQPDKVKQVVDKIRTDGLLPTLDAVWSRLDQALPLGYCNAGEVLEVGDGVTHVVAGDRVVSNGPHAEVVHVPQHLCAKIPPHVSDDAAAFTVLGAISLQGIRLALPTLGERFVVTGLGVIGLITVQLLRAHGCSVLGIDMNSSRVALARQYGADTVDLSKGEDPVHVAHAFSEGRGVDGVLITASTKSNEPMRQAARMCRKRGRIVLVGVTGLELSRADFYEKELRFQVSCSYGPGRYDPSYEAHGHDYPFGFVRWTVQRNFDAVLEMLAAQRLVVDGLISHRVPVDQAEKAYKELGAKDTLGVLLQYGGVSASPPAELRDRTVRVSLPTASALHPTAAVLGVIGAGQYATHILLPNFKKQGVRLKTVVSSGGLSAANAAKKFGFEHASTDAEQILNDAEINTVVIATRHDSHAHFACRALERGKHVFVEKPLALTGEELNRIVHVYTDVNAQHPGPLLMVGFNRRFAPHVRKMKALLSAVHGPKSVIMTVNAGEIPEDHWTQDPHVGGGRIIGEGCHFIDLLRFVVGHAITDVQATIQGRAAGIAVQEDKMSFTLRFTDGSVGTVHYLANGHKSFPKERLEVFSAGRILQLDNFKRLTGYGWPGFKKMNLWRQDKGHAACVAAFVEAIQQGTPSPIPFEELGEVTRISFEVVEAAR